MSRNFGIEAVIIGVLTATIPTLLLIQKVTFLFVIPLVLGIVCILLGVYAHRTEGRFGHYVGWIVTMITIVAVPLPFGMIAYYDQPGYPVALVLPDGYRGPVRLIVDRERGIDVPLEDGRYTYRIPDSGTLLIKDDGPFHRWHTMTASYANGNRIPGYEGNPPNDAISLHSLGSGVMTRGGKDEHCIEDFVGTEAEFRRYVDRH
jgi:hypothetical protein